MMMFGGSLYSSRLETGTPFRSPFFLTSFSISKPINIFRYQFFVMYLLEFPNIALLMDMDRNNLDEKSTFRKGVLFILLEVLFFVTVRE